MYAWKCLSQRKHHHFVPQTPRSVCENTEVTWNACGMSCSSSVTKTGLCICQAFCNLQPFWGVISFRLYTPYVNTLHHCRPGFKHMRLDWVFWVLSTREFLSVFSWTPQLPRDRDWKLFVTLLSLCPLTAYCYGLYSGEIYDWQLKSLANESSDRISVGAGQLTVSLKYICLNFDI